MQKMAKLKDVLLNLDDFERRDARSKNMMDLVCAMVL